MQFTGVDKFFRGKISQYKKWIFWKKKVTKDWHYLQSTASISPPELAFQFTYSSMGYACYLTSEVTQDSILTASDQYMKLKLVFGCYFKFLNWIKTF